MRMDRGKDKKKKKRKNDDPIILKETAKFAEKMMDAVMLQIMEEFEKMWVAHGGTVSK